MTNEEMLDCLQSAEKSLDLTQLVYNDIAFWPLLRVMLYNEHAASNGADDVRKTGFKKQLEFVLSSCLEQFYDRTHNAKLSPACGYFLTMSNSRYLIEGKGYLNTFASPLLEWTENSCHIDELAPMGDYRLPRSERTCFIQRHIYRKYLWAIWFPKSAVHSEGWQACWESLRRFLLSQGCKVTLDSKTIAVRLRQLNALVHWFKKRLLRISPRWVAVNCYYSTSTFALIYAAKQLGIKTIDLQHGVQGRGHVAYAKFYNLPERGWSLLPDIFWNWTEQDANYINSWGNGKHQGLNGGIIWHYYLKNTPMLNEVWNRKLKQANVENRPYVLVTFQPLKDNQCFITLLKETMQTDKGKSHFWLLRLHPSMFAQLEDYQQLFSEKNCSIELATQAPLPLLLDKAVLHITRYSSVVIEATMYGVTNFVERGRNYYQLYEQDNYTIYFSNDLPVLFEADFEQRIKDQVAQKDSKFVWQKLTKGDI